MFDCPFSWDARAVRYGKQLAVGISVRISDEYGIVPGSVVRVRFVSVVGGSWGSPRPQTIMHNSMVRNSPYAPVLDPDGVTWTARVIGYCRPGRMVVRIPPDVVRSHVIVYGVVVRL